MNAIEAVKKLREWFDAHQRHLCCAATPAEMIAALEKEPPPDHTLTAAERDAFGERLDRIRGVARLLEGAGLDDDRPVTLREAEALGGHLLALCDGEILAPPPIPRRERRCACADFDDGSSFMLSGWAGGAARGGAFSWVDCAHKKKDGTTAVIRYVPERDHLREVETLRAQVKAQEETIGKLQQAEEARLDRKVIDRARHLLPNQARHDLYETGDAGAPEAIKDRNGEVTLGLCRRCGKGEAQLSEPCTPKKDPAAAFADAVRAYIAAPAGFGGEAYTKMMDALATFEATPRPASDDYLRTAGLPDEKKIARFLLDAMTGGSLSSLICEVRDHVRNGRIEIGGPAVDNLRANLRALGEEILP